MNSSSKVALITGAGTGIGRAVTHHFLRAGWRVVLTGRREELLQETVAQASESAENALCVSCDIGRPDQVVSLFDACREKFGRLDMLFNNAGRATPAMPMEELPYEMWQSVVDANLTGAFLCSQQAIKMMKAQNPQGGRIINNGSISAQTPRPFSAPYTSTKHAITGLTKTIALDGRPFNIACGQIDIGNAETPMTKSMPKGVPQANGEIAGEPIMDVNHVAEAILNMAELPLESNVLFMTIMATNMPFVGRG